MAESPAKPAPRKNTFDATLNELRASRSQQDGSVERGLSEQASLMLLAYALAAPAALKVHDGKDETTGKDRMKELSVVDFAHNIKRVAPPVWVALRRASPLHFCRAVRMYGMPSIEPLKLQAEMAELAKSMGPSAPTAAA